MKPFDVVSSLFCGGASLLTSAFGLLLETGSRPAATRFLLSCQKKPWKEKARLAGGLSGGTRCALAALRSNSRRRFDYLFWAHATLARAWGGGVSAPPLMAVFGGGFNRHKLSFRKANEVSKYFLFLTINFSTCNRTSASDATICAQTVSSSTRKNVKNILFAAVLTPVALCFGLVSNASEITSAKALKATSAVVLPAMEKNQIPGMAVALVLDDKTYIFNYGVSDVAGQSSVTDETIFEIGSVSKTFTATLATYAEAIGKLKLTDTVAKYLPELAGTDFGNLQLLNLGTHTVGGIPLQVPDEVQNKEQLLEYFRAWKPAYKTGTMRTYANPSIGALGWVAAKSLDKDFNTAMTQTIFQPLGLSNTYLSVPAQKMSSYSWGYNKDMKAVRVNPGMLDSEAYGIKTTASDLSVFVKANMGMLPLDSTLQTALNNTRNGYFQVGKMTQDLIWEQYVMPVDLQALEEGNSSSLILNPTPVIAKVPPSMPKSNVWVNKTGSTNGFGAYVAFVPAKRFGIVLLANKNYPNAARVEIAHKIYSELNGKQ